MRKSRILEKLEIKRHRLFLYHEAEAAILSGQSYEMEGIRLTRADLEFVQDGIADLENEIESLEDSLLNARDQRKRLKVVIPGGYLR